MTSFTTPARRVSGELDVYTALLAVAILVLAVGVVVVALRNLDHSRSSDSDTGGMIKLVQ